MTKLIFVRHGQSEANLTKRFAGHYNCDLTEYGKLQAQKVCEYLTANFNIDKIYSSDLLRAYNTAKPTADKLCTEIEKTSQMREIAAGKWEGLEFEEILNKYEKDYTVWLNDIGNAVCTLGESVKALYERVLKEITRICEENDGKTILITTHATPIRAFQTYVQNGDFTAMRDVTWVPNCSTTVCNYDNGKFSFEIIGFNDYLEEFKTKFPSGIV